MDRVLILEGNADYARELKSGLDKMHQFHVTAAVQGKDAVRFLQTRKVSVLVTDINPPGFDAIDILAYYDTEASKHALYCDERQW